MWFWYALMQIGMITNKSLKKISPHSQRISAFCPAGRAGSEKIDAVRLDIEVGRTADFVIDFREEALLEIDDLASLFADQVVV
jgi:hypothetical protein